MENERIKREQEFHNEIFSKKTREVTNKFYSIFYLIEEKYLAELTSKCPEKRVLEYGCGEGSSSYYLAQKGGIVTGIDISDYAVMQAQQKASSMGLEIGFVQMNAEELTFVDNDFDLICGSGIIHHLDIEKSYSEISRVLKADGTAIFMEPLGHNVFVNWYRKKTPALRTEDEHPLLKKDLLLLTDYFGKTQLNFYFLSSLVAIFFRKTFFFKPILRAFYTFDRLLFWLLPFLRWQAWFVLITFSLPKKGKPS